MIQLRKVWAWLKKNWVVAVGAIGAVLGFIFLSRRQSVVVVDPTSKADDRAKHEENVREAELAKEEDKLKEELEEIKVEHDSAVDAVTEKLKDETEEVERDSNKVREYMLKAAKGE